MSEVSDKLINLIADMEEDEAVELARVSLDGGMPPAEMLEICRSAMDIVGKRFEDQEYFIPELILAGEMLTAIGDMVKPLIAAGAEDQTEKESAGLVLIGTVHGDLHDIGKNIVTFMLDVNGFEVVDLGIDVPPERFIEAIKEHQPPVVGLSGFLTLAFDSMKETVDAFVEAGIRDDIKVMIGGGQVDDAILKYPGADAFGINAMQAVSCCKEWTQTAEAAE